MPAFANSREILINAHPETVHTILDDFHLWSGWSPWEEMDPDLKRTFSGPQKGVGSQYAWEGNKKVGTGRMEMEESTPERIKIDLQFIKPFKASSKTIFELRPEGSGTHVVWTMTGERNLLMELAGKLYFDKAIGKDFEKGLGKLKVLAEN